LFFSATGGGLLGGFTDFAGELLKLTKQFLGLVFDVSKTAVCELGPLLFQPAFGDVAIAFDFEFCHKRSRGLANYSPEWLNS
jgi:hypothetical protein